MRTVRSRTERERLSPREAVVLQRELASRVVRANAFGELATIAGVDTSIRNERVHAAICVFAFPRLELLETRTSIRPVEFPYVPGLLAFREIPALLEAFAKLSERPDFLLVDGHGLAHPRRFGIACHLGVELDLPAIGCGKSLLVGKHREPAERRGSRTRLCHQGEVIGAVLRTRTGVRPVYVSIGHKVDLATAVKLLLACTKGFRLPEPVRAADQAAARIA